MRATTIQKLGLLESFALVIIILTFFLVAVGVFQFLVVKWVVALNFDSVDRMSFLINEKTGEIMKILGDEFVDVWEFSRRKDNLKTKKPTWVLKCSDLYGNTIILTLGSYIGDEKQCVLATVARAQILVSN